MVKEVKEVARHPDVDRLRRHIAELPPEQAIEVVRAAREAVNQEAHAKRALARLMSELLLELEGPGENTRPERQRKGTGYAVGKKV